MRFRSKNTLLFLLIALIPMTLIGAISYYLSQDSIRRNLGSQFQFKARVTVDNIDRYLFDVLGSVKKWADLELMQEVKTGDLDGRILSFLVETAKGDNALVRLDVLNVSGEIISSSSPQFIGNNLGKEEFVAQSLAAHAPLIDDVKYFENPGKWGMEITVPIFAEYDRSVLIGLMRVLWDADNLSRTLGRSEDSKEGNYNFLLIRKDGLVIAASPELKRYVYKLNLLKEDLASFKLASKGKEGFLLDTPIENKKSLTGYSSSRGFSSFPGFHWISLVYQDSDEVFAPITRLKEIVMLFGVFVALGVCFIAFSISRRLTGPILSLAQMAAEVAAGKVIHKIEHKSKDEIGLLISNFNEMVENLKKTTVSRDALISEVNERKRIEKQLEHLAFHDTLTGLPNRALLHNRLSELVKRAKRYPTNEFAVFFIDLNRFKNVNDSLGHFMGDELLVQLGKRFRRHMRDIDTVARIGGDEFVMIADGITSETHGVEIVHRLLKIFDVPFKVANQTFFLSASIGIVFSHTDKYDNSENILRDADIAMYDAKLTQKPFRIFDKSMHQRAQKVLVEEMDLRQATQESNFVIHYQPIVNLTTRKVVRVEALLRWVHPQRGLITPAHFIPLAEETGLIIPIGEWLFREVLSQVKKWNDAGCDIAVSVNFSPKQLQLRNIAKFVQDSLRDNNIKSSSIEIEITETMAMEDMEANLEIIKELRRIGVGVALDDFGTGYSSLNYLRLLPISHLKIDREFVRYVREDNTQVMIMEMIIRLAKVLKLSVVAEGVETQTQLAMLEKFGCDEAQGFLFSVPLPSEEVIKLFNKIY